MITNSILRIFFSYFALCSIAICQSSWPDSSTFVKITGGKVIHGRVLDTDTANVELQKINGDVIKISKQDIVSQKVALSSADPDTLFKKDDELNTGNLPVQSSLKNMAWVQFLHPTLIYSNITFLSGQYDIGLKLRVNDHFRLELDCPVSTVGYKSDMFGSKPPEGYTNIGNLYFGIESIYTTKGTETFRFGAYLPTADRKNPILEILSDYYNFLKFTYKTVGLQANYSYKRVLPQKIFYDISFGGAGFIPVGDGGPNESEFFLRYAPSFGFDNSIISIGLTLNGIFIVTDDPEDFGDRFVHYMSINVKYNSTTLEPELFVCIPLSNNLSSILDNTIGIKIAFLF